MFPDAVFGDGVAQRSPLMFAGIHASYALASCAVSVVSWRIIENSNSRALGEIEHQDRRFRSLIENSADVVTVRSEEHTSELQSLMRISYAVFCLKKKNHDTDT